jgi:hypothetical protein
MTYRVIRNTKQNALVLAIASNSAIVLVGNNSDSAIGLPAVTANIAGVTIKQIWSSADSGAGANGWDVIRAANTIWQTDSTSWLDFAGNGCAIDLDPAETLTLTRTGARGTIMLELQKYYLNGFETDGTPY